MAADGTVLWKCGACEDCFYDLQALANHKCGNSGTITLSEQCIKQLEDQSFASDIDHNDQVEQAISTIAALEDENVAVYESASSVWTEGKQSKKAKPTVIAINNNMNPDVKRHQKAKRSLVWAYFTALDFKKAMCCICHKVIAYCGTPTNLVYHLNRFHPNEAEVVKSKQAGGAKYQYLREKIPKTSTNTFTPVKAIAPSPSPRRVTYVSSVTAMKKPLTDRIIEFISTDLLPLNIVDGAGFKKFISSLDPTYVVPDSKKLLKDLVPKRYYSEFKKVKSCIGNADKIHLSIELWVGGHDDNFLTITSHFITNTFELKCYVLNTTHLDTVTSYQSISTALLSCISEWDITAQVMCVVTDNVDVVSKAVKTTEHKHIACLAHILNKIINDAFQSSHELKSLVTKCRGLVSFFKQNNEAKEKLMKIQTQDKDMQIVVREDLEFSDAKTPNCPLKVKKDNQGYWITIFYMMQRIFTLRNAITMIFDDLLTDEHTLTDDQWLGIEETISLFKAFEVVTLELCNERYPSLSKVIPIVQGLLSLVTNCSGLTLNYVERVRKDLLSQLRRHLGLVEQNTILATTTILDPRFKNIAFQSDSSVDAAVQNITVEGRKYRKLTGVDSTPTNAKKPKVSWNTDSLWECFDKKATPKKDSHSAADDVVLGEVKNYFEEPLIDRKKDPILWWREYGSARFPVLAEIAKQMLSIPSTSMPPERIFLQKEQTFFEKREAIKTKYMHQFLFLNGNID